MPTRGGQRAWRSRRRRRSTSPIHGHRRAFVKAGSGPALLLLHGLGCDHTTWEPVIDSLARRYTVIAPDLLGPRAVGQAARRLQRRRLRQRHARPADRARHRQGHRRRAQLRRWRGDAVRLPVPRAHRAAGAGRAPAASAPRSPRRSGRSPRPASTRLMGLLTLPGVRHVGTAGMRALPRTGLHADPRPRRGRRDLSTSFKDPRARARDPARGARRRRLARARSSPWPTAPT